MILKNIIITMKDIYLMNLKKRKQLNLQKKLRKTQKNLHLL